jgi:AcrR family transcriptional regulator
MPVVDDDPGSLRARTRRAVQVELIDVAQRLFADHGYEAVTVEQIAVAAGMSKRSFFRYFDNKEAVVLGKYDRLGEDLAAALAERPSNEPLWTSLRRMFDGPVDYVSDPVLARRAAVMDRVIHESSSLHAGYLERLQRAQQLIVAEILRRRTVAGAIDVRGDTDLAARALVAAAFAAFLTAHEFTQTNQMPLADALDDAMDAIARDADPTSAAAAATDEPVPTTSDGGFDKRAASRTPVRERR